MIQLVDVLSSAGIAAVVSAVLTYLFKPLLEARLQRGLSAKVEALRAAYISEHEYLRELIKRNADLYPNLIESVYRSRNIARELQTRAPAHSPVLRAELGTHALALVEGLYRARLFLAPELFKPLHQFKQTLEKFVFDYDLATGPNPGEGVLGALRDARERLDELYQEAVSNAQAALRIGSSQPGLGSGETS
jgi:hypothetical protein